MNNICIDRNRNRDNINIHTDINSVIANTNANMNMNMNMNVNVNVNVNVNEHYNLPQQYIINSTSLNENEFLCGQGGCINSQSENKTFRDMIYSKKENIFSLLHKEIGNSTHHCWYCQQYLYNESSWKFLEKDSNTGKWYDIGDTMPIKITEQAFCTITIKQEQSHNLKMGVGATKGRDTKKAITITIN